MIRKVAPLALALCLPLLPKTPLQQIPVVTTSQVDFAAGGTIRIEGSVGELNIEGWDQPQVQVVLTRFDYAEGTDRDRLKSKLEQITVKAEKQSATELTISTALPHRNFFVRKVKGKTNADLNYRIMVPRDSHLIIHHGNGDVILYNVGGDIEATTHVGAIVAQLQDPAQYAIDAHTGAGEVNSDYDGKHRTHVWVRESFVAPAQPPAHKIFLRVKIGDIDVVKMGPDPIAKTGAN
jgi:hypothetical protein